MQHELALRLTPDQQYALVINELAMKHKGRANGIGVDDLSTATGIPARTIRKLISKAREEGVAILATPNTGYFVAQTKEELEECCAFLHHRAMHSLKLESRMRNIALAELLGQLHLNT